MKIVLPTGRRLKVVCSGGNGQGAKVLDAEGFPINFGDSGLSKIEFEPLEGDQPVRVKLTIEFVDLG